MTENNEKKGKLAAPKKLQLTKTVEAGRVQQTFARGRSKSVTVEVKRTRTFSRNNAGKLSSEPEAIHEQEDLSGLTEGEKEARLAALKKAAEDAEAAKIAAEKAKEEQQKQAKAAKPADISSPSPVDSKSPATQKDSLAKKKPAHQEEKKKHVGKPKGESERRQQKLTITTAMFDQDERVRSLASIKRARQKARRQTSDFDASTLEKKVREVTIPEVITVQELANRMAVRMQEVVKELMKLGIMATGAQTIDADTAELVVTELGHKFKRVTDADVESILIDEETAEADLKPRPPVVTIMGHVDHGKTSLLDALRETNVTAGEAGGITQHIGAYQIKADSGDKITFLDTPGHEAFTAMRARGAKVTDIAIIVVAADDSIMPQTEEAISHAKAAEVPIIVAINKIDLPDANVQKVRDSLFNYELIPEESGGETQVVEISAKEKLNLDKLLDAILLQAEMLELKAGEKQRASGTVIEAKIDKGRGIVATLLVQKGTLKSGDIVVAGTGWGKIRAMTNDIGMQMADALPSMPVEILGLDELPSAGDEFAVVQQEKQARDIIEYRKKHQRDLAAAAHAKKSSGDDEVSMDKLFQVAQGGGKELRLIIKADVQGSAEAIIGSLDKYDSDEVRIKVIHSAAGGVTGSDVSLAATTGAIILGFNVRAGTDVRAEAEEEKVDIRYYSVIYNLIDDMKAIVSGMLDPIIHEKFLGNAEILQIFKVSGIGKVAGCKVREGSVKRGAGVRLIRDNIVIHEGKLKTLKRFKDEVTEVDEGTECGMAFENYDDIKAGDTIEAFEIIEEKRKL